MRRPLIVLLSVVALFAVACGGEDTTETSAGATTEPTKEEATSPATETTETTDDADDADDDIYGDKSEDKDDASADDDKDDADAAAPNSGIGLDSEQCQELAQTLSELENDVAQAASGGTSADAVQAQADALADADVSDEIADDLDVIAQAFNDIAVTLNDLGMTDGEIPGPEDLTRFQEMFTALSDEEFQTASTNISTYVQDGCPA